VPSTAVEFDHVVKRYSGHLAVDDMSLVVHTGTVFGLLGPNGAGKTTTLRMLLNILEPDEGVIRLFGEPTTETHVTDRIGYLPEERGLYKKMTVRRVLRFLAQLKGVPPREADRRIDRWLERFGLRTAERDWGRAKVDELSRGMQQKVQFIATVLHEPDLVVLDEPFAGLDPVNAQVLKDTVLDLRAQGRTVILSTHVIDNAERMCDAVCIMARGRKILDGSMAEVKARYGGPPVERLVTVQPSLHEIFLQQVGAAGVEPGTSGQG
jgi:ABC-2 type transport system ATP-binding protein